MNFSELKKKIGPLFVFGFEGKSAPNWIKTAIQEWNLGGVILFRKNIESKEQLKSLIEELKSIPSKSPLFISVDHEGGRVFRLPPPFTQIPTARKIGEEFVKNPRTPSLPFEIGKMMAKELSEVGFNLNFAPVLDIDTHSQNPIIGDRAFGQTAEIVSQAAIELIFGLRSGGVIPCGKHFPGHGETSLDSHLDLPTVEVPLARLEEMELLPFQAAIQEKVEMIMTAHVIYTALDPKLPATLSDKILTKLLREKMKYDGVVISDDLIMKAIADHFTIPEAARMFLDNGGDIPLICHQEAIQNETVDYIEKSILDGKLKIEKIEKSLSRISKLKSSPLFF